MWYLFQMAVMLAIGWIALYFEQNIARQSFGGAVPFVAVVDVWLATKAVNLLLRGITALRGT
jgi:hypothetical protein